MMIERGENVKLKVESVYKLPAATLIIRTLQMDSIFTYDNGRAIRFFVDNHDKTLIKMIKENGGEIRDFTRAQFHIGRRDDSLMSMSGLPIIHPVWVVRSIKAKQLLPMYCFSDEPQISSLRQLSAEQRDLAELLKARTQYTSDQLYEVLHECLPHRSTNDWRKLYNSSRNQINAVAAGLRSKIDTLVEDASNKLVSDLFTPPHPRQRSPSTDIDTQSHQSEVEESVNGGYHTPEPPRSNTMKSYITKCRHQYDATKRVRIRPKGASGIRRFKVTPSDVNAMVRFVHKLGREPTTLDWQDFYHSKIENQKRTPAGWNTQYSIKRDLIRAAVKNLREREA